MLSGTTRQAAASPPLENGSPYDERRAAFRAGAALRAWGAVVAAACGGVLALAASLTPSADGFGTHHQLGLPQCGMLSRTGYPCPTCGATTATAYAVRGRLAEAWKAHPFGVFLTAFLTAAAIAGLAQAATGRPMLPAGRTAIITTAGLLFLALAFGWAWKVLDGLRTGSLPLH
jgi:hypothetical protein